jgi:poly(3-hydroxybutyrate) depolymerase
VHAFACSDEDESTPDGSLQNGAAGSGTPGAAGSGTQMSSNMMTDLFPPGDQTVHPSAGCGKPAAVPAVTTLTSGGQEGHLLLTVPPSYDPNTPMALGFVFHGANNTEIQCYGQGNCLGVQMALANQSIVIYPRSFGTSWTNETREQNVVWFDDLLAFAKENYCVDERRVFVMGTSSGAHFSNILGCRRGDQLLAIAPGAGERLEKSNCKGKFAALVIHGIDDDNMGVPFPLGEEARDFYAQANGCSNETLPPLAEIHADVRARRDAAIAAAATSGIRDTAGIFRCADYQGCDEGLPVRWCEHGEDGYNMRTHGYPLEGGPTTWEFVSQL